MAEVDHMRVTRRALTLAVAMCVLASAPGPAAGAPTVPAPAPVAPGKAATAPVAGTRTDRLERQADIKDELRTLREQVSEASEEEANLLTRLDEVQDRKRVLDARVAEVDRQAAAIETQARAAEDSLEAVQSEFVRAQTQLVLENEALAVERGKLRDRAVAAYIANPSSNAAELMLRAKDLRQIAATAGYLEAVVEVQTRAVRKYTERRDATDALRASVEVQKDEARRQRDIVVNRLSDLEAVLAEQQRVRDELANEEAQHAALLEEVRLRRADFEAEIASLRAESATVSALLQGLPVGIAGIAGPGSGVLAAPVAGAVTSQFGPRVHPIFGNFRNHDGVDFGAVMSTPIRAAAAGTVVSAGVRGGYGNATIIDHGNGLATLYAHQSELFVVAGAAVTAGQVIGAVGSTGFSTGPHLHFEVRLAGSPVDPLLYLAP
ncbi:MAG: murein hydrolase activator EnvC family protein [Acidimicrobiales bacterium]